MTAVVRVTDHGHDAQTVAWYCPACRHTHSVQTLPLRWMWNGDMERPCITPSVLHYFENDDGKPEAICHYFIRDGRIEYCSDSPHGLAGQSVDLLPVEEWPE